MKAVCICGSPNLHGNTSAILSQIVGALKKQGVEVVQFFLGDMDIGYCTGCKSCYTDGKCIQSDDVQVIISELFNSQLVVLASPSYWGDVTGQMKVFIDRCTSYCNTNAARLEMPHSIKGAAVAIRAGRNKKENENLIHTFEHFLGHLDIPLISSFTVEGVDTADDLKNKPEILLAANDFGNSIAHICPVI